VRKGNDRSAASEGFENNRSRGQRRRLVLRASFNQCRFQAGAAPCRSPETAAIMLSEAALALMRDVLRTARFVPHRAANNPPGRQVGQDAEPVRSITRP